MKLRESLSTLALALADLAQSARTYTQFVTGQPVPLAKTGPPMRTNATLMVIDDEELWEKEQQAKLKELYAQAKQELNLVSQGDEPAPRESASSDLDESLLPEYQSRNQL